MKKVYLFLAALTISIGSFAQLDVQIFDEAGNDVTNGSTQITGVHPADDVSLKFKLKNNAGTAVDVKVRRDNVTMPAGFTNSICFGTTCFPATADETLFSQTLNPSDMDSSFHAIFFRNGVQGTSDICITYKVFNANDESQFVTVRAYYGNCLTASIAENSSESIALGAFPNPASGSVVVKYNSLNAEGQLLISDITGKQIKNIRLNAGSQSTQVDISDLKAGIYIYSIQTGAKKIVSKKLVVR